jgi:hypothetical protein
VPLASPSSRRLVLACPSAAGHGPGDPPGGPLPGQGKPKLLDRVRATIRVRGYSLRTEEAYVGWIKRFVIFHGKRHPLELGAREVEAFLQPPGDIPQRQRLHAEPGPGRDPVPLHQGPRPRAPVAGSDRPRQAGEAAPRRPHEAGSRRCPVQARRPAPAHGDHPVRVRAPPPRVPAAARQGHRFPARRDPGPRGQGQPGPGHHAPAHGCRSRSRPRSSV